jgi:GTPase SAR1 family protein
MIVGHGEAGKTALMQRLICNIFDGKVDLTDGINVQAPLELTITSGSAQATSLLSTTYFSRP